MLTVEGLNAHYGRAHILADVALTVGRGEVLALLGRNGAGKSTTMKSIVGLVPPTSGRIGFAAISVTSATFSFAVRLGMRL